MVECLESILYQSFEGFELIILDDYPGDKICEEVIKSYKYEIFKYFRNNKNLGISRTGNKLIDISSGECLIIIDHDDIILVAYFAHSIRKETDTCPQYSINSDRCGLDKFRSSISTSRTKHKRL